LGATGPFVKLEAVHPHDGVTVAIVIGDELWFTKVKTVVSGTPCGILPKLCTVSLKVTCGAGNGCVCAVAMVAPAKMSIAANTNFFILL
jgi:hypothetical protein